MSMSLAELGEISKAKKFEDEVPEDFRRSRLQAINPRSRTYVKEGTNLKRVGIPLAGGIAGNIGGQIVGSKFHAPGLGAAIGSAGGTTAGLMRNIKSGETVSYNRRSGKKAKAKANFPIAGTYNLY